jgi:TP901 family phage tail tape measure protein
MADRTTKVSLVAQASGYIAEMQRASKATRDLGSEAEKLANKRQGFEQLGRAALAVGVVAAAAVGLAVAKFVEFDRAMSNVQAATQETAENMGLLREAALQAGADTAYTAAEAAGAIEEMGKAGVSTADILNGGLNGALDLAAAGQLDVARAGEVAAISMKQFGLAGRDIPHIADLLAAGAGKAAGDVEDLSQALGQSALVANQTGLSIEETTGTLAAFASAGLLGSDAGTSLRTMLLRLTPQSKEAADKMKELGFSAFDASGEFIGMEGLAGEVAASFGDMSTESRNAALSVIFGQDAIRGANILYAQGAEGIGDWVENVNDSGYAAQVAADRLDNLSGDIEKLGGALDTALIQTGSGANEILRQIVQSAEFLVNAVGDLPEPVLGVGLALGGLVAAVGLVGGAALIAVPKVAAFKAGLIDLGVSGRKAAVGIGAASVATAAASLAIGYFVSIAADQAALVDELTDSYDKATGAMTNYTREIVKRKLADSGAYDVALKLGYAQDQLTDAVLKGGDELEEIQRKVSGENTIANFFNGSGIAAGNASQALRDVSAGLEDSKTKYENLAAAGEDAAGTTDDNTAALNELSGAAADAGTEVEDLADQIRNLGSVQLDVDAATRAVEKAVDDFTEALAENGATLDAGTEEGRANQEVVEDTAAAYRDLAASLYTQTGSMEEARGAIERGRQAVIDQRIAFGDTAEEASAYADSLGLIPDNVNTIVTADTTQADPALLAVISKFNRINGAVATSYVDIITRDYSQGGGGGSHGVSRGGKDGNPKTPWATGGFTGSGGKYEPAGIVHRREFVSTAETTANPYNRAALEYMHRGGVIHGYAGGGYVTGNGSGASASGPAIRIENFNVNNPRQLTAQGSTVSGLRQMSMELGL